MPGGDKGGKPGYIEICIRGRREMIKIIFERQKILLTKENQIFQVKQFSFSVEGCKSLGLHKFLRQMKHLIYLGPVSCAFNLSFSGLSIGSGCSLMTARWQIFFLPEFLKVQQSPFVKQ